MTRIFDSGWCLVSTGPCVGGQEWRAEHEAGEVEPVVFAAPADASRGEVLAALDRAARQRPDAAAYRPLLRATWTEQTAERGDDMRRLKEF